jgi:hypothetical protein
MKQLNPPILKQFDVHRALDIIYDSANSNVVGYLNEDPDEQAWFFFIKDYISELYSTKDKALEELVKFYIQNRYDTLFSKMGLVNNENFVKGK